MARSLSKAGNAGPEHLLVLTLVALGGAGGFAMVGGAFQGDLVGDVTSQAAAHMPSADVVATAMAATRDDLENDDDVDLETLETALRDFLAIDLDHMLENPEEYDRKGIEDALSDLGLAVNPRAFDLIFGEEVPPANNVNDNANGGLDQDVSDAADDLGVDDVDPNDLLGGLAEFGIDNDELSESRAMADQCSNLTGAALADCLQRITGIEGPPPEHNLSGDGCLQFDVDVVSGCAHSQWSRFANAFGRRLGDIWGFVKQAVTHPIDTVRGLAYALFHPVETFRAIKDDFTQACSPGWAECAGTIGAELAVTLLAMPVGRVAHGAKISLVKNTQRFLPAIKKMPGVRLAGRVVEHGRFHAGKPAGRFSLPSFHGETAFWRMKNARTHFDNLISQEKLTHQQGRFIADQARRNNSTFVIKQDNYRLLRDATRQNGGKPVSLLDDAGEGVALRADDMYTPREFRDALGEYLNREGAFSSVDRAFGIGDESLSSVRSQVRTRAEAIGVTDKGAIELVLGSTDEVKSVVARGGSADEIVQAVRSSDDLWASRFSRYRNAPGSGITSSIDDQGRVHLLLNQGGRAAYFGKRAPGWIRNWTNTSGARWTDSAIISGGVGAGVLIRERNNGPAAKALGAPAGQ